MTRPTALKQEIALNAQQAQANAGAPGWRLARAVAALDEASDRVTKH